MKHLFRARYGLEESRWLLWARTPDWPGILEIKKDTLVFRVFSSRQQTIRATSIAISSIAPLTPLLVSLVALFSYAVQSIPQDLWPGWLLAIVIVYALGAILLFFLAISGLIYLLDFLTLHLQARYSKELGILKLKDVRLGRFRHIIKASLEKELVPTNHQPEEVVITVAATKRALTNALRSLPD